jgi:hypothetical protein
MRRRRKGQEGQALVEFALTIPILLILVLGVVEFARAWSAYQVITDAAREAARTAVVDNPSVTLDSVQGVVPGTHHRGARLSHRTGHQRHRRDRISLSIHMAVRACGLVGGTLQPDPEDTVRHAERVIGRRHVHHAA